MRTLAVRQWYVPSIRTASIVGAAFLVLLLACLTDLEVVKLGAALFLYGLAPGLLLTGLLFARQNVVERLVLSVGSSLALSTLVLLVVTLLWNPLTADKIVVSLVGLLLCLGALPFLLRQPTQSAIPVATPVWLSFLLVLVVAGALRLPGLGKAELQDDEIDVGNAVHQVIRGDTAALFRDRRGPAQTLITAAFYLVTEKPAEWILRTPVALTNLAVIAGLFVLAWVMFNWQIALVSGLLLSLDGFVLAYGRVVQMQSTLLLMMVLASLCFYLAYKTSHPTTRTAYVGLGALFFAFGLLAHYEMILMLPVLAYLYFAGRWQHWGRVNWRGLAITLGILALVAGGFYAPFVLNPAFQTTYAYYSQDVLGQGIRDNLQEFMLVGTMYNSTYYLGALWLLLGVAWTRQLRRGWGTAPWVRWLTSSLGVSAWILLTVDLLAVWRNPWVSLIASTAVAVLCLAPKRTSVEMRLLFLWFFTFFILYSFRLRELHVHYYAYSLPWALLGALSLAWCYQQGLLLAHRFGRVWVRGYAVAVTLVSALFLLLCAGYLVLVFLQALPEYALTFPQFKNSLYVTLYDRRYGEAFGFPHESGWKTIGYLYRTGALRGGYETNELYLTAEWYTRHFIRGDEAPRYYFVATVPHRLQAAPWPRPFEANAYHLIGMVTVKGQPRLLMYERNEFPSTGPAKSYAAERYGPLYDQLASVDDVQREARFQADDQFFRAVAQHLTAVAQPQDALLLYAPQQAGILSYYYQGGLPYYLPGAQVATTAGQRMALLNKLLAKRPAHLYALYWGEQMQDPTGRFEIWLNEQLFKLDEQWFGNLRLVRYDIPEKPLAKTLAQPLPMMLGEQIRLEGYTLAQPGNVHLSLFWQAIKPVTKRYKVFVHLLDQASQIVSQNDSEPGGGRQPTDGWPVAARGQATDTVVVDNYALMLPPNFAAGAYRLEIGMYDPATGARLPVLDERQQRQPNDAISFAVKLK